MPKPSRNAPPELKERLRAEAGGKCANPGCPTPRTYIHHIDEWHVYQTHNKEDMVAVCPTCHDHIHHGQLPISDEMVRGWKAIHRTGAVVREHFWVEPPDDDSPLRLKFGEVCIRGPAGTGVVDLEDSYLGFEVIEDGLMLTDLRVSALDGTEIVSMNKGHFRHEPRPDVTVQLQRGHFRVTAPVSEEFLPALAIDHIREGNPGFASDGQLVLLDLEVISPGTVKVQGIFAGGDGMIVGTSDCLYLIVGEDMFAVAFCGVPGTELLNMGDLPLLAFGPSPGMIQLPR